MAISTHFYVYVFLISTVHLATLIPHSTAIFVPVQFAQWPFAKNFEHLKVKPRAFAIEIGANNQGTLLDDGELAQVGFFDTEGTGTGSPKGENANGVTTAGFLLTFEPLLDKYADLLHSGRERQSIQGQTARPLGFHHERGMVLPFAVSSPASTPSAQPHQPQNGAAVDEQHIDGFTTFHVSNGDGCSSLSNFLPHAMFNNTPHRRWHEVYSGQNPGRECDGSRGEKRAVPFVSLKKVLGDWLGMDRRTQQQHFPAPSSRPFVEFAKVDAQGKDLLVVLSAGHLLHNLRHIRMESTCDQFRFYEKVDLDELGLSSISTTTLLPLSAQLRNLLQATGVIDVGFIGDHHAPPDDSLQRTVGENLRKLERSSTSPAWRSLEKSLRLHDLGRCSQMFIIMGVLGYEGSRSKKKNTSCAMFDAKPSIGSWSGGGDELNYRFPACVKEVCRCGPYVHGFDRDLEFVLTAVKDENPPPVPGRPRPRPAK